MAEPTPASSSAPPEKRRRRALLAALAVFCVLCAVGAGSALVARWVYVVPGPLVNSADVVVPHGGLAQVARALRKAGVIRDRFAFTAAATITHGAPLRAAEFLFPAGASLRDVLAILRTARPVEHKLTIPEGATAAQIAEILSRTPDLAGDTPIPEEGAALPQTYDYEYGATRAALLQRATDAMTHVLAGAWANRAPDLPLQTPEQALILASIVERETSRPDERPHVAAVFLNRLRRGMRLQADSTLVYAATGGNGVLKRPLSRADLARDEPYNTYIHPGLPPGPIASPGLAAIQAVLHPIATDDLYFVADGTGGHAFAATLADHDRNVAHWRTVEKR